MSKSVLDKQAQCQRLQLPVNGWGTLLTRLVGYKNATNVNTLIESIILIKFIPAEKHSLELYQGFRKPVRQFHLSPTWYLYEFSLAIAIHKGYEEQMLEQWENIYRNSLSSQVQLCSYAVIESSRHFLRPQNVHSEQHQNKSNIPEFPYCNPLIPIFLTSCSASMESMS